MEGASSNPVTVPYVFLFFFRFYNLINLFIYRYNSLSFPNYIFRLINIALMTANNAYPIELMHSVVSRIYVPCLIMSHLIGTLYKC